MKIVYKVPNGKLLKIDAEIENGVIKSIEIHGDFFVYPEDGVEIITRNIVGNRLDEELILELEKVLKEGNIETFGFNVKDLIECLMNAK